MTSIPLGGAAPTGRTTVWAGRVLSGIAILFLTFDAGGKLVAPDLMIANSPPLGIPADPAFYRLLGTILAICTALYAWPRTAVLGAVLLTGYLGGAVASHLPSAAHCSASRCSACISGRWCGAGCGCATGASAPCCRSVPEAWRTGGRTNDHEGETR